MGEEKRLALSLVETADELPAHERVELRVLVDRPIDGQEEPRRLQGLQVLVEVVVSRLVVEDKPPATVPHGDVASTNA